MRFDRSGTVAVVAVTAQGARLGALIAAALPDADLWAIRDDLHAAARVRAESLADLIAELWAERPAIVGVMASGILVRSIAPLVTSKLLDPAVVAVDDAGRFAISLLSGHEGGANALAADVAEITGALPVVTTASEAACGVTVGVGSRRGVPAAAVLAAIDEALASAGRTRADVRAVSTIDLKADEPGIRQAAESLGVPLRIVPRSRIAALQEALREPTFAEEVTGVAAVCVPSAILASPHATQLTPLLAKNGVTVSLAEDDCSSSASAPATRDT